MTNTINDHNRSRSKGVLTGVIGTGFAMFAPLAAAHHPMGGQTPETFTQGLLSGFGHPILGIDHFAFLLVVALLSMAMAGKAKYLVPLAFVGATVMGTLYHLGAADLPWSESVIALSVLLGGLFVLLKGSASALLLAVLVGVAGVFHGYAYGEAIVGAETSPLLSYLVGFSIMQYAIIVGISKAMQMLADRSEKLHGFAARFGGISATAVGALFLGFSLT